MKFKKGIVFCLLGGFLLAGNIAFGEDAEGSKDHPLVSRFPGSTIRYYDVKQFDEYVLPLGKAVWNKDEKKAELTESQRLEGKVTRIQYGAPEDRSTLEIFRNYEAALKKAGFEILFAGAGEELGGEFKGAVYPNSAFPGSLGCYLSGKTHLQRYLSGKLSSPEGDVYVALYISLGWYRYSVFQLDVIEVKPMETELVVVNADALAQDIAMTGHAAVYGIYFDTDKAEVKPESELSLKEIAKLLQQNPQLKLYVVGHTDNAGGLDYNMGLSKRRAESVVKTLVSKHNVDTKRLKAYGVSLLAPVASNKGEDGRAKNRRVELVEIVE